MPGLQPILVQLAKEPCSTGRSRMPPTLETSRAWETAPPRKARGSGSATGRFARSAPFRVPATRQRRPALQRHDRPARPPTRSAAPSGTRANRTPGAPISTASCSGPDPGVARAVETGGRSRIFRSCSSNCRTSAPGRPQPSETSAGADPGGSSPRHWPCPTPAWP